MALGGFLPKSTEHNLHALRLQGLNVGLMSLDFFLIPSGVGGEVIYVHEFVRMRQKGLGEFFQVKPFVLVEVAVAVDGMEQIEPVNEKARLHLSPRKSR